MQVRRLTLLLKYVISDILMWKLSLGNVDMVKLDCDELLFCNDATKIVKM